MSGTKPMDISAFETDIEAVDNGIWVFVDRNEFGPWELLSRGHTEPFIDAREARRRRLAVDKYNGDLNSITNLDQKAVNVGLMRDFLIIDSRGLQSGGKDIPVADLLDMMGERRYGRIYWAAWNTANRITLKIKGVELDAVGNSPTPLRPNLSGAKLDAA